MPSYLLCMFTMKRDVVIRSFSRGKGVGGGRAAFTLLEMMVVVGVSISLAAVLLIYGSNAKEQSILSIEEAKIAQLVMRARSLAISTFNQTTPPPPCGYGVRIQPLLNPQRYVLFSYDYPGDPNKLSKCRTVTSVLGGGSGAVYSVLETHRLDAPISFVLPNPVDWMQAVFFKPPDPTVLLLPGAAGNPPFKKIYLTGKSGGSRTITVTNTGQIAF